MILTGLFFVKASAVLITLFVIGYLFFRRIEMNEFFKNDKEFLTDLYKYAEIATDLGVTDFAAQLFWLTASYSNDEKLQEKSINSFLYCLEK